MSEAFFAVLNVQKGSLLLLVCFSRGQRRRKRGTRGTTTQRQRGGARRGECLSTSQRRSGGGERKFVAGLADEF